ncbi:bombesin receptor-activated protein C6orf89-like protein [Huso huso]|uniref:Bombesin receptor-activated protein C6orf89-like protein n=1 Tax=Huso huso TaxID=61971 RepID=A0ABR0YD69_HUSHU
MGLAPSEPCIYEKLSESVDILRRSGYRYGMSEREIEKFIKQVLETNEPRREPPQFPILLAACKLVIALGFLLVAVLAFTYPLSSPQYRFPVGHAHNWSSPISHVRLLSLPIAKKYNLEGFHEWWRSHKKGRPGAAVNCSECASVSAVLDVWKGQGFPDCILQGVQPVVIEGGQSLTLSYADLEQLYSRQQEFMDLFIREQENLIVLAQEFPKEPSNFILLWKPQLVSRQEVLQGLFPSAELQRVLDREGVSLKRCLVTDSQGLQSKAQQVYRWLVVGSGQPSLRILPLAECRGQCSSFNVWLEPGDMVYADSKFWQMDLFPGRGQSIVCDGFAF